MKKSIIYLSIFTALMLFVSGCTNTIHGIKDDTCYAWYGTKHVIHDATADD